MMNSFTAEIGSRGYHVYRDTTWRNITLHEQVRVLKETNELSKEIDPYCCKITITRIDRIVAVTVGHIPRELSRFVFYFIHEGGSVSGTVASLTPNLSPIPEGGLEIPILMHFTHGNKVNLQKMNSFVRSQIAKMEKRLDEKKLFEEDIVTNGSDEEYLEEEIIAESDDDDSAEKQGDDDKNEPTNKMDTEDVIIID